MCLIIQKYNVIRNANTCKLNISVVILITVKNVKLFKSQKSLYDNLLVIYFLPPSYALINVVSYKSKV